MKKNRNLVIATYNIQFSLHTEEIAKSVTAMASMGAALFCLQEVLRTSNKPFIVDVLLERLGNNWKAIYNLGDESSLLGMGNCILWDETVLNLKKEQKEQLPKSRALALHEKIFSWFAGGITTPFQRRVIIGYFLYKNMTIRITNVHLDHNGGTENRRRQLLYLMDVLNLDASVHQEILCGDFNSFDLLKNEKEKHMLEKILNNNFSDISKDSGWTADLNNVAMLNDNMFFTFFIKNLHMHIRRKLDYVWTKNIESTSCKVLSLDGSDHRPLIACLNI